MTDEFKTDSAKAIPNMANETIEKGKSETKACSAWMIRLGVEARLLKFTVVIDRSTKEHLGISEGDAVLLVEEREATFYAIGIARIFRERSTIEEISFYSDGVSILVEPIPLVDLGLSNPTAIVTRLEWPIFEKALKASSLSDWASFPVLSGNTPSERAYVRDLLQDAVMDDLLGPADGPYEEIIGMSVRDRYLVGKLAPMNTLVEGDQVEDLSGGAGSNDPEEATRAREATVAESLIPSSMGFTFCVDQGTEEVALAVRWGRYERRSDLDRHVERERFDDKTKKHVRVQNDKGESIIDVHRVWKRIPAGGDTIISLLGRTIAPLVIDLNSPEVVVKGTVTDPLPSGERLVTLFMINQQIKPKQNQDAAWVFQPELIVRDPGGRPIFRKRPVLSANGFDEERESLEMIYRKRVEFAVGHGVSVHARSADGESEHADEIRTCTLPRNEVEVTETPGLVAHDREALRWVNDECLLDMKRLAELDIDDLVSALKILTDDYGVWISEQRTRIGKDVLDFDTAANDAMDRCERILERLREGIDVITTNPKALEAFRFANQAMAAQRIHSIYALLKRRGEEPDITKLDIPKNRSWRPFQLAFVLLSIPALADPTHGDRTDPIEAYADLLWFPTGGGKTEAYLGVAAFTMAIRRRHGNLGGYDSSRGLAVIMRYTLRLLTLQQFQRATTLICAMEVIRRGDSEKWGGEPFTIGLWVGNKVTPGDTEESHFAIDEFRGGKKPKHVSPAKLGYCPWCGAEIEEGRHIEVRRFNNDIGRTLIYCGDKFGRCEFSNARSKDLGIPVLVVDDEIYRRPPSMLIATVDKFAMMAWRGQVRTLFGKTDRECDRHGLLWADSACTGNHNKQGVLPKTTVKKISPIRPPDLIIQDEFHLISGPLGTMVGLYETAVDELSSWEIDGKSIKPKIIASTATVRKADAQVNSVFLRRVAVFPPHGLDIEDNFFSVQRPIESNPGRLYMGICSPGSSRPAVLIRVYVALLTAAQALFDRFGQMADPYMTLVGYFNSLRELGGMRRLAEDDVQTRSYRVQMSEVIRPGLAQRSVSRIDELTSRVSNKDIQKKLDQLEVKYKREWKKDETRSIDIVLATNMLSVGVDVDRLGLMVVNGQPKSTAEYIQATSRVGRSFPGLVCTVLTWSRPRDLSHYETFEHYHATFYKHVEAQSVTPFAPRALDRGLMGTMISMLRLGHDQLNPNEGAEEMNDTTRPEVAAVKAMISDRAWKVKGKDAKTDTEMMVADRIDRWVKEANKVGRHLGYETRKKKGDVAPLLKKPGAQAWDEFTVPMSMREVEPGVKLIMDVSNLPDPPPWRSRRDSDAKTKGGKK